MLNFDIKRKINTLRDILVGKVPDPKAQVEQITIALIYKFMDDMDIEGMEFGGSREFFKEDYEKYAWSNIMQPENSGQQRANLYAEGIDKMSMNPHLPQLFRDIFRGAYVPYRDAETLNMFLKEINDFTYDHSEELGNAFEYLLSIMGSQGDAGQFRTPRHIIDMMVEIVDPQKTDSILDPACGTAGFLISSYKHILEKNKDNDGNSTLSADDRKRMTENFAGYDISPDMVRLSRVNMYLHKFAKPQISEYDTLSSLDKWDETYDVILANPPFMTPKGGIIPHNRYRIPAKRAEVLFVDYIAEHLNPTGKAAVIVPEGIVFQSANAYKSLRKYLVEDGLLYAVISLPAGVFNPYSGVKTSILLMDKTLAKQKGEILFVKISNDGYDLGAQRREVKGSDIPEVIKINKDYQNGIDVSDNALVTIASKRDIAEQDYILVGERYKEAVVINSNYPMVELGEIVEILDSLRKPVTKSDRTSGIYPYYGATGILDYVDEFLFDEPLVLVGEDGAKWGAGEKTAFMISGKTWVNNHAHVLRPIKDKVLDKYLTEVLNFMDLSAYITGVTVPKLNQQNLRQIKIPLPPLPIQEEIVKEIEGYQKIIDGAKQVVENYKPTIKIDPSWEIAKLGDVGELTYGFTDTAKDCGNARFIRITDIDNNGLLRKDNAKYLDITDENKDFVLRKGDLLVARTGATYGKTMIFEEEYDSIYASFLIRITFPLNNVIPKYYWIFAQTDNYWKQANDLVTGGGQPQFNANAIKQIQIPIPPIDVQRDIVERIAEELTIVEQNKRLIELFEQKIKDKISEVWGE
jgi:type I restriction enzyme M protein